MKATIGIPTLGRIPLLRDAIASAAAQNYRGEFEVVIADNSGDLEKSAQIAETVAEFSGRVPIRCHRHAVRVNPSDNANSLVAHARGEYFTYLPDDDRLGPDFLSTLAAALDEERRAMFAFSDHWLIRADGSTDKAHSEYASRAYARNRLQTGFIPGEGLFDLAIRQSLCIQATLWRKTMFQQRPFSTEYMLVGDAAYFIELAATPELAASYYCAKRLMDVRVHGGQETLAYHAIERRRTFIAVLEKYPPPGGAAKRLWAAKLAQLHQVTSYLELEQGDHEAATAHARRARELTPGSRGLALYALFAATPRWLMPHIRTGRRLVRDLRKSALKVRRDLSVGHAL